MSIPPPDTHPRLTAVVIDDEGTSRMAIRRSIERYCPDVTIVAEADSAEAGRKAILRNAPELVFLDVEMPRKSGFELLDDFPARTFGVILVTAHGGYAARAAAYHALDCILKPVGGDALRAAVGKARQTR